MNRKTKKLSLGIAGVIVLVAFLVLVMGKAFIGILPNWVLVPIGVALIVLAVLLPLKGPESQDKGQHEAPDV